MRIAQQLYEGIEVGAEGPVGLITYMRTDSVRVADSAIAQARDYIAKEFGKRYLPAEPVMHKGGKSNSRVQDAHEAIRPTDVLRRPDDLKQHLDAKQFKLYQLVWRRFVASQMTPAVFETTKVDFDLGRFVFRPRGRGCCSTATTSCITRRTSRRKGRRSRTCPRSRRSRRATW